MRSDSVLAKLWGNLHAACSTRKGNASSPQLEGQKCAGESAARLPGLSGTNTARQANHRMVRGRGPGVAGKSTAGASVAGAGGQRMNDLDLMGEGPPDDDRALMGEGIAKGEMPPRRP